MHSCLCSFLFSLSLCPPVCCQLRLYTADFLFSSSRSASLYNAISLCSPITWVFALQLHLNRTAACIVSLPSSFDFPTCLFCQRFMATSLYFAHYLYSLLFGSFLKTHSMHFCSFHYHFSHVIKRKPFYSISLISR